MPIVGSATFTTVTPSCTSNIPAHLVSNTAVLGRATVFVSAIPEGHRGNTSAWLEVSQGILER
ncbi:MAG TPA: hypothetical protein VJT49_09160 [Amycolatopsis sp.]|uniref:hypothetical protein n=1 Tax=Amycolatopsis sp. TaxID=37632 RepID=UPI002B484561|nr:hypothetical protein [Amycolatopsis sp.]HKS45269.1 hypothetical protein [Amycolatopsis sp.]